MFPIQLFDADSCTFTYIVYARPGGEALIIDPVASQLERDLEQLKRLELRLSQVLETHVHADHITSAHTLRELTGAKVSTPEACGVQGSDAALRDGDVLHFNGAEQLEVIHTPGHTRGSSCFLWRNHLFTGDTLLIDGCGRTDFQGGCAEDLHESVVSKLFSLPGGTLIWPGHDYQGRVVSTIEWERNHNSRLANHDKQAFASVMRNLNLARPRMMDIAVPANSHLGRDVAHD